MDKLSIAKKYFRYQRQDECTWQRGRTLTKTVVEIPARSGSTRLKDKNIYPVCGIPLLAYTVMFAKSLRNVDRVIVNTDSVEYARIAEKYGAEVPFLRPPELAGVDTGLHWSSFFLRRYLMDEDYPLKKMVTLLPTSPFRNKRTVESLIDKLNVHYVVSSAFKTNTRLKSTYCLGDSGALRHLTGGRDAFSPRFFIKTIGMVSGMNVVTGSGMRTYVHFTNSPIELIDIDTTEDIEAMGVVLERNLYDFGCRLC